jgi:hypothetical protein
MPLCFYALLFQAYFQIPFQASRGQQLPPFQAVRLL